MRHVTKGNFLAHVIIDYGVEFDLFFWGFLEDNGEPWAFNNKELRADKNITIGRTLDG
jgi:hypothetical protein